VRVTGGIWASRRVPGPPTGCALRPTPDALREQAFAILAPRLPGAVFLDLFAGTGIVSLEALSRGAAKALLVEHSGVAGGLIRRNFDALSVPADRFELVRLAVVRALPALAYAGVRCDLAWCDPPFADWEEGIAALDLARAQGVLATGAAVVLEAPPKRVPAIPGFAVVRALRGAFLLEVSTEPQPPATSSPVV
jgi:16S rRNA (guanine966-N2)-methyltransferase